MLEGLDAVDWRALKPVEPDLSARDVPKVLRRFARADATTREVALDRACGDLHRLLVVPGRVTDAGTAALPFLVDLVTDPDTVRRLDLVMCWWVWPTTTRAPSTRTWTRGGTRRGSDSGPACGPCSATPIRSYGGPRWG
ncbi:hypothetical protein ACIPSA_24870 [Streptomyces sp. NPDC086549]|uniref:hypothetical protein n=1 Tax=Streptomyces sp. NPDC086549 TaxID=3365752 RepID=UPI00382F8DBA